MVLLLESRSFWFNEVQNVYVTKYVYPGKRDELSCKSEFSHSLKKSNDGAFMLRHTKRGRLGQNKRSNQEEQEKQRVESGDDSARCEKLRH